MGAPRIPGHTCPAIDRLKRAITTAHSLSTATEDLNEAELRSRISEIEHELRGEAGALEDLREANLALRTAAEYWQIEVENKA